MQGRCAAHPDRGTVLVAGRAFRVVVAVGAALATFLIIGVPTDIIPNPMFGRDVPVRPWELPVLAATSGLTGLYFGLQRPGSAKSGPAIGGAGLAMFAVACPVCNKIVLLALGTSGALRFWQPLQPFLAGISLAALTVAVAWAWRRNPMRRQRLRRRMFGALRRRKASPATKHRRDGAPYRPVNFGARLFRNASTASR